MVQSNNEEEKLTKTLEPKFSSDQITRKKNLQVIYITKNETINMFNDISTDAIITKFKLKTKTSQCQHSSNINKQTRINKSVLMIGFSDALGCP